MSLNHVKHLGRTLLGGVDNPKSKGHKFEPYQISMSN